MTSLRARAVAASIIWALSSILIGVFGLASYLDNQTQARFDELLINRHTQAVVEVANYANAPDLITNSLADPAYGRPFSGQYWQVEGPNGQIYTSQSMVESLLPRPAARTDGDRIGIGNIYGPGGEALRRIQEWVTLGDGSVWHVQVASSLESLMADRSDLRGNLILAFSLITVLGVLGAFLQATTILRPLNTLRQDVLARWDTDGNLDETEYPTEVAPLVTDINTLIERNREIVSRSRRQAADLAHAVKTPSAIVRNELERLLKSGQPVQQSLDALDRLDAQLKRSFARMRADGGNAAMHTFTDLDTSLGRMTRAFTALARNDGKTLTADIDQGLRVRMDQSDFEEVIGNLVDNATKWSTSKIHIRARQAGEEVEIQIEDDGPGIPEDEYGTATLTGQRLDTSKPGTGLGLAIAADLAHAYGGKISLGVSDKLGGLKARVRLKTSGL